MRYSEPSVRGMTLLWFAAGLVFLYVQANFLLLLGLNEVV